MNLHMMLLGVANILEGQHPSPLMNSAKGLALISYLLVTDGVQPREKIADLLWDASSTSNSLNNLRELLVRVRKWVPMLQVTRKTMALLPAEGLTVDLWSLQAGLDTADLTQLDQTLQLYTGPLLGSFYLPDGQRFNEWLIIERERLQRRVFGEYERLCTGYFAQQRWQSGCQAAERWLALDTLNEEAYRQVMRFLAADGQLTAARAVYERCRQTLWQELAVEPAAETAALAQNLEQFQQTHEALPQTIALPPLDGPSPPGLLPVNSYLPYHRNPDFTGRETFLLQMAQTLLPQPDEAPQVKVAAVSGMGGLGKTQLAVEFAYRYGRYFSGGVYWVGMANEKHVAEEISRLGGERGMKLYRAADNLVLADRVGRVQQAWQAAVPRLLIFDNCEEESVLRRWLPVTGHCAILITCRRPRWPRGFDVTVLPLEVLSETESGRFLQRLVPRLSEAERLAVSHEVGQLPLALQLAGSFLNRYEQLGGEAYIQQLQQMDVVDHPSLQGWGSSYSPTGHERHIGEMFALSVNKLETAEAADQIAKQLLVIMTCFAPGEPVSTELLQQIMVPDQTDWQATILFTDGLNRLITLGLVRREGELTVAMHRLVVACVMGMIDDVQKEEAQTAVRETLMERLNLFRERKWDLAELPFSPAQVGYVVDQALQQGDQRAAVLAMLLGRHFVDKRELVQARFYLTRALAICREQFGEHYQTVRVLGFIGTLSWLEIDNETALPYYLEAAEMAEKVCGPNDLRTAHTYNNLGVIYSRLDQIDLAHHYFGKTIEIYERTGETDGVLAMAHRNLGLMYASISRFKDALTSYQCAIKAYQQLPEPVAPTLVFLPLNSAIVMSLKIGAYEQMEAYIKEAFAFCEQHNIEESQRAYILCNQAILLTELGQYASAQEKFKEVLRIRETTFGETSIRTAMTHSFYGYMLTQSGDYAAAQQRLELAVEIMTQHPESRVVSRSDFAKTVAYLGELYHRMGQIDAAYQRLTESIALFEQLPFPNHIELAKPLISLAEWHLERGNRAEGQVLFARAAAVLKDQVLPTQLDFRRLKAYS